MGTYEGKPQTLEEVGQAYGFTRERARQLQNIAIRKMQRARRKKEKESVGSSIDIKDVHSMNSKKDKSGK